MSTITIITANYNFADTLSDCIESVISQTQSPEYIIIDGASSDATPAILDQYKDRLTKVISESDRGMYDGLNKGIKLATGEIIEILNADDFYPSNDVLAKVIDAFEDTDIEACYGDLVYVDSMDIKKVVRYWRAGDYDQQKFLHGWMPPHPTLFIRRSIYERYGVFNLELGTAADYELILRFLLKQKIRAVYIPEVLVHMRTGGMSNVSIWNRLKANQMDRKAWEVNELKPYPWTLIAKPLRKLKQWIVKESIGISSLQMFR